MRRNYNGIHKGGREEKEMEGRRSRVSESIKEESQGPCRNT
jgi:hypothetical protein